MNRLIDVCFDRRGYTTDFLKDIDDPSHDDLINIHELCAELKDVHDSGRRLVILPDFDMDGIMSGTLGFAGFSELGFAVSLFRPSPSDGYGFNSETVDRLLTEYPDTAAIITCDVGITCSEGIARAHERGVRVFVTDHHMQSGDCSADIIVDPNSEAQDYGKDVRIGGMCGAAVFWNVLDCYAEAYGNEFIGEQIRRLRVFAGIGTVSDVMPMLYGNRELVRDACGICRLVHGTGDTFFVDNMLGSRAYVSAFRGLYAALDVFFENGKLTKPSDIDEEFFGYYLAPMFNSVKRMDGDMDTAFGVFFGTSPRDDARELFELNEKRKATVARYYDQLMDGDQDGAPFVYVSDAPAGILGLLATKVLASTGMPVVVVRQDGSRYHGSGRAPAWYPALTMLHKEGFWAAGHDGAFGVGVTDRRELGSLSAFLERSAKEVYAELPEEETTAQGADIVISTLGDGDTDIDIPLFAEYVSELRDFAPFGRGFEAPVVEFRFAPEDAEWSTMGSLKQHVKGRFAHGFELLVWNGAAHLREWQQANVIRAYGKLGINAFAGRRTVNFIGQSVEVE